MVIDAKNVSGSAQNGVVMLTFANDAVAPSQYVLLQRALNPSQQDKDLGQDRVHIQINAELNSGYGDISEASLDASGLSLRLSQETAARLRTDEHVEIRFNLSTQQYRDIETKLATMIGRERLRSHG